MAEVTIMVLKVDLGCHRCYRKIKKLLCNYPAIRDQAFYEKEDTVIIKVVCCSPERIRQKLISKGGKTIKSIETKVPEKPKPPPEKLKADPPKPVPAPAPPPVPDEPKSKPPAEKLVEAEKLKKAEKSKPPADKLIVPEKPKPADPPKEKPVEKPPPPAPKPAPAPAPAPSPAPVPGYPQLQLFPVAVCCQPCYDLGHGGPCHHGYGTPYQLPSSHDGYVRLVPSYDEPSANWPSGCRCNRSYGCRCEFFTEENPACTIM